MTIADYDFTSLPTLETPRLRLEPQGAEHLDGLWASVNDVETLRLTGTHARFSKEQIRAWLRTVAAAEDRADWAVVRRDTGQYLGEIVLNDLARNNASMGYRIGLSGPGALGQGYGTEAGRAVIAHAFDVIGLHRVALEVYAFNPRAVQSYRKIGFVEEGRMRDALHWDGEWVDALMMSILSTDLRG
ncbi:GNAT family N-acetyltransferase [Arthrobacter sp. B0490]|uniref:GNAT family N-acetyltransferase n=1 Tax=Arthrobacter sp. B0490 TaxID=2058891 RepID=UPI000CE32FA1|nr:GNAT family protein [Arthrobacter sp. B0490]